MATSEYRDWSDLAIPPGETLEEELEARGISQKELAMRLGRPAQVVNEIIRNKKAITPETAFELEAVLDVPAHFWINLQTNYEMAIAREAERAKMEQQMYLLKGYPVRELEKRGWMRHDRHKVDKVRALCQFLGVASLDGFERVNAAAFRITGGNGYSTGALAAWMRKGELDAANLEIGDYDKDRFRAAVKQIRGLTSQQPNEFLPIMEEACASAGVALVVTPELPKSGANGVARWLTSRKAMIQLSLKWKWADVFWFTFFHEAAHILLHRRDVFVDLTKQTQSKPLDEQEADKFAADVLIPSRSWDVFVTAERFTAEAVRRFAGSVDIDVGIVVGRLQREGYVAYNRLADLKKRYEWKDQSAS